MKHLLIAFTLLFSSLGFARSIELQTEKRPMERILNFVSIDGVQKDLVGKLNIDFRKKAIRLELFNDPCGQFLPSNPGEIRCMAAAMLVQTLEVPLQETTQNCGSMYYSGLVDQTPFDGFKTQITAIDHSHRICEDVLASMFVVQASTYNPWIGKTANYYLMQK